MGTGKNKGALLILNVIYRNLYMLTQMNISMGMKLHLHANFPHDLDMPNAATGYLKSFLSKEKHLEITNVYWYLIPREIVNLISSTFAHFQDEYTLGSHSKALFAAYLSRFFYKPEPENKNTFAQPTAVESFFSSRVSLERIKNIAKALKEFFDYSIENEHMADVDMAGFTVKLYQWFLSGYIWSKLKDLNPNITIVVGGLDTQDAARAFMETFKDIDYAVWGEGEVPLRELVRHADDTHALEEVPRLVYRKKNELHVTDVPCGRLATYPFADHTDYFKRYRKLDLTLFPQIPIFGTRSCRWNRCKFCNLNKGGSYYERPIKDIIGEIEYQSKRYAVDRFLFLDSDIGRKNNSDFEELLTALLNSVSEREIPYDIGAEISPLRLNRKNVQMMSKIRISVQIGFEAVTDSLLKKMNKMHHFAENIQALKFGKDYELTLTGLNIIRNLPDECEKDIIESMENLTFLRFFLNQYTLDPIELNLYKGTQYYEEIPLEEREKRWVVNVLYTEMNQVGLIEGYRWEFFGFASNLKHHLLWNQFVDLLKKFQKARISYVWLEFNDGSSLIEEQSTLTGPKNHFLNELETTILKFCDSIKHMRQLENEFPHTDVEAIVSHLRKERLLYYDDEKKWLISVLSAETITREL